MNIKIELNLGIIDSDQKRVLECYIDARFIRQRKSYSEYYVDINGAELDLDIKDLMILGEQFNVSVHSDSVTIEEY